MPDKSICKRFKLKKRVDLLACSKAYNRFIIERCEEIVMNSSSYKKQLCKCEELRERFERLLNNEQLITFEEIIENFNTLESLSRTEVYKNV